jgi:hypothetical protein
MYVCIYSYTYIYATYLVYIASRKLKTKATKQRKSGDQPVARTSQPCYASFHLLSGAYQGFGEFYLNFSSERNHIFLRNVGIMYQRTRRLNQRAITRIFAVIKSSSIV